MQTTNNQTSKEFAEELMYGQLKSLLLPSGYKVTIREQNGADDDIISNPHLADDLSNMDIFLSSLIIETDLPFAIQGKLSKELVKKLLLRDKYFILFSSRIHSLGNIVKFQYDWGGSIGNVNYEDDLNNYVCDYNEPMPLENEEGYYPYRILPYDVNNVYKKIEHVLKSGKTIRYSLMDGESELYLLKLPLEQQTRNRELKARKLEQKIEDKWQKVENFLYFTPKDMAELHALVNSTDASFQGLTELENPQTKENILYPIIGVKDFFYPVEI